MADEDTRSALLKASTPPSKDLFRTLVTANHILHYHSIVDAFGHISVRNPQNPQTFFLARSRAPALISARADIEEYRVADASPVNEQSSNNGYVERFIHSEIFKKYPGVNSVVHAHAEPVIPFGISSIPLRPVYHMAGSIGAQIPVYDIALHYKASDDLHSLLVNNEHLGAALAAGFAPTSTLAKTTSLIKNYLTSSTSSGSATIDFPPNATVLMRGHGFTCVGKTIEEAVYRAVYTVANARIQTTALLMQGSFNVGLVANRFGAAEREQGPAKQESIKYLADREIHDTWTALQQSVRRSWELWCVEVAKSNLYANEMDDL